MKSIWKYELKQKCNVLEIPSGFKILSVIEQFNHIVLYCLVDPSNERVEEYFHVVGTGWELDDDINETEYIGTVSTSSGGLIWHVFHDKE